MTTLADLAAVTTGRRRLTERLGIGGGTLPVAAGTVLSGVTAYLFLIVAARQLGPVRYSALSAVWTLVFLLGPGCFAPMEQEVCRAAVARRAAGKGDRPIVVRGAQVGGMLLAALLVVVGAISSTLRSRLFEGDAVLVLSLALGLAGYYCMHLSWGALASRGHFRGYGIVAGSEGIVRLVICGLLVLPFDSRSLGVYGIAIALAPLVAASAGWRVDRVRLIEGPPEPWGETGRAIGYLLGASILKLFVLMVGPLAVQLLATATELGQAGRYLAALALTRVPLFLFNAVLVALLPKLSHLAATGRRREFSDILRRLSVLVAVSVLLAAVAAGAVGPRVLRLFFGGAYSLPSGHLVILTLGCGFYMLALVLSYGLIATDGHRWTVASWLCGCLSFVVVVAAGSQLGLLGRVEWGFLAATFLSAATMATLLLVQITRNHEWLRHPEELVGEPIP